MIHQRLTKGIFHPKSPMVEIEGAIHFDEAHKIRLNKSKCFVLLAIRLIESF